METWYAIYTSCERPDNNFIDFQFGTDGREQIIELLERCNKIECLVELDEDESDDGEEEEEDKDGDDDDDGSIEGSVDEEDVEEEIDDEIEYLGSSVPLDRSLVDPTGDVSRLSVDETEYENSVEAFCNAKYPAETLFYAIDDNDKTTAIRNYLKTIPEESYLTYLVFTILKCAELSLKVEEALKIATELFKDTIEYAQKTNRLQSVRNFFLIQLGLLKSEDKNFKPQYNVQGCRHALKYVLNANIIPVEEKNIYEFFLEDKNRTAPIVLNHP